MTSGNTLTWLSAHRSHEALAAVAALQHVVREETI
jgi:hypothetical protein